MPKHMSRMAAGIVIALCACSANRNVVPSAVGSIEYTETDVSPLVGARVLRVLVDEGVMVHAGDTLAVLTQSTLAPEIDQRRARLAAAEADLRDLRQGA